MEDPKLYIIATPLGNRGDITLRAIDTLKMLEVIFAEDSRELIKLLEMVGIPSSKKEIYSYAKHNMKAANEKALRLLGEGRSVGLVTDRGTPGISDPGALLAREARETGVTIVPIPGPSSVVTALCASGFSVDRFLFLGFLPETNKEREARWKSVQALGLPVCFFESPKRIQRTAAELKERFPRGQVFFAREMTKLFESFQFTTLESLDPSLLMEKGEYVVVMEPGPDEVVTEQTWEPELELRLMADKPWAKHLAERYGIPAATIYNALQKRKTESLSKKM